MDTKIQRWGNSLAVRIPKAFAEQAGVVEGSAVDISVADDSIVIRRRRLRPAELDDLLAQVTPENLHGEIDTGASVGREAW
jgi:antitoxin MazE